VYSREVHEGEYFAGVGPRQAGVGNRGVIERGRGVDVSRRTLLAGATASAVASKRHPMGKGICSTAFAPTTPLAECIWQAAQAGFQTLEIRLGDQIGPDTPVSSLREAADAAARNKVRIDSVWVSSRVLPQGLLNHPDRLVRTAAVGVIRKSLRVAAALSCPCVLLNPVRVGNGARFVAGYRETWDRFTQGLRLLLDEAAERRVVLTPENVLNRFLLSPLEAARFVDQFASPWVAFHLDIGNVMPNGYPQDWIRILGPRIRRVHAKDVKLHEWGFEFVDLLRGDVDWPAVIAALGAIGFRGALTCESEGPADDRAALRRTSAALDEILAMS
jgi:L-ribulose-5-phosphate 3-epimerase